MSANKTKIIVAVITVIGVIVVGYWQYVPKNGQTDEDIQYTGRVTDGANKPVSNAKVSIEEDQRVPQVQYTDAEGVFHLKLRGSTKAVRVRVDANGYTVFERNVSVSRNGLEPIRLEATPTPTPTSSFAFTFDHNPTLEEVRTKVAERRHVNLEFNPNCGPSVRRAEIKLNGAALQGSDVKDLLEKAKARTNVNYSVIIVSEGASYKIDCGRK